MNVSLEAPLILASASPRRKEILEAHGFSPIVIPSGVEEILPDGVRLTPEEISVYLAQLKADDITAKLSFEEWPLGCIVLGVDTIVYKDRVIGKPVDEDDALSILRSMKNVPHEVISGVCLIKLVPLRGRLCVAAKILFFDTTTVRFGDYTDADILDYIRSNPPYDKSGSYAIQSDWNRHVLGIDGDIENVIGLPYQKLSGFLHCLAG